MRLFINGESKEFAASLSLAALIEHLGMKGDRVAVEVNRKIISRMQWAETWLSDGDELEIVHFVGGGAEATTRNRLGLLAANPLEIAVNPRGPAVDMIVNAK
jgi:thiamine biosynthesis protein ThiS